jgi:DNA-binding MarR family transcriptional regulator
MPTETNTRSQEDLRELRALEEIERNPHVSQRQLASSLGVALGVANACIHTLARKGLVKVRGESNRTISYHLTKKGLTAKARLALEWTNNTINDYVQARRRIAEELAELHARGTSTVILFGANEAAELIAMLAPAAGITVVAVVGTERARIAPVVVGIPVVSIDEAAATSADAVIVCTDPDDPDLASARARFGSLPLLDLSGREF